MTGDPGLGDSWPAARVAEAGRALWHAWQTHQRLDPFPGGEPPPDLEHAYAVQDAMIAAAGLAPAGWKIGATNRAAQHMLNLDGPLSGRLLAPFCFDSPAILPSGDFALRLLEPEIAFRLASDLPPRATRYAPDEVAAAVASAHPALEIPDTRLIAWDTLGAAAFIADNGAAGRFVLGPAVADWSDRDLGAVRVRLVVDGCTVAQGCGRDVMGGPLHALAWLADHLPARGAQLRAGDLVTTGTCTPIGRAEAGAFVEADFGEFGRVTAHFG